MRPWSLPRLVRVPASMGVVTVKCRLTAARLLGEANVFSVAWLLGVKFANCIAWFSGTGFRWLPKDSCFYKLSWLFIIRGSSVDTSYPSTFCLSELRLFKGKLRSRCWALPFKVWYCGMNWCIVDYWWNVSVILSCFYSSPSELTMKLLWLVARSVSCI